MAAPEYVPTRPLDDPRSYKSPPRRPEPWLAERPGEVVGDRQPRGERLGNQGPDQGYAYKLLGQFAGRLRLTTGEDRHDMQAGGVAVGLKRASLFGRAPVVHDLTVAFTIWGFLDEHPPADLVMHRRRYFEGVANPHHYVALRALVDAVPDDSLRKTPGEATRLHGASWRSLLPLPADG
jgi:hypothetical protein